MNTKIEEIDGKYVATLVGEMDTVAATEAEEVLKPLYTSDGKDVVIDCKDLEYIASSGLRILLSILKTYEAPCFCRQSLCHHRIADGVAWRCLSKRGQGKQSDLGLADDDTWRNPFWWAFEFRGS